MKVLQVFFLFADSDQANRDGQFLGNGQHDPAFCRPIQLREGQARDADGFMKLSGLGHGILPDGAVKREQHFMRGPGIFTFEHPFHFFQFLH